MMDQTEFNQRVNAGGTGAEPYILERLLANVTEKFEKDTRRLWQARTGQIQQWEPDLQDRYLWFWGVPVINNSNFNLMEFDIYDGPALARPIHPAGCIINWISGEIQRQKQYRFRQIVVATYDCGLTTQEIPEWVKEGLVMQARYTLARWSSQKIDIRSHSTKGSSAQFMMEETHPLFDSAVRRGRRSTYGVGCTGSLIAVPAPAPNQANYGSTGFNFGSLNITSGQGFP